MRARPLALVTVMVAALGTSIPASADTTVVRRLVAGGTYTGVLLNGLTVAFDCTAAAVPDAVSTAITSCYLTTGGSAPARALPGPAVTTVGVASVPLAPFQLCYAASATFIDAARKTVSGCTPLLPPVGGIPPLIGGGATTA